VELAARGEAYFRRTFRPQETDEVRLYLKGGDDRAVSEGRAGSGPKLRVVGGEGQDVVDDSAGGNLRYYDASGADRLVRGPGTRLDDRPHDQPRDSRGAPARDWGNMTRYRPWVQAGADYGVILGAAVQHHDYAFRKHPYGHKHELRAGYSTELRTGGVEYEYESLRTNDRTRFGLLASVSGLETVRFFGLGNETRDVRSSDFYQVEQTRYVLAPSYRLDLDGVDVEVGPRLEYADTSPSTDTLLGALRPYGVGRFGQLGAGLALTLDRRDPRAGTGRGALLSVGGTYYPALWSVTSGFGEVHGEGRAFLGAQKTFVPTLAARVGGRRVFGMYPFHESAWIGGSSSLRGLRRQRYRGDGAAYGNVELRLPLVLREKRFLSGFGIFGLADAGRVFLEDESSDRWHHGAGGGAWIALARPSNVFSVTAARSEGRLRVYFQGGFMF
jgi:hypothetical protein